MRLFFYPHTYTKRGSLCPVAAGIFPSWRKGGGQEEKAHRECGSAPAAGGSLEHDSPCAGASPRSGPAEGPSRATPSPPRRRPGRPRAHDAALASGRSPSTRCGAQAPGGAGSSPPSPRGAACDALDRAPPRAGRLGRGPSPRDLCGLGHISGPDSRPGGQPSRATSRHRNADPVQPHTAQQARQG